MTNVTEGVKLLVEEVYRTLPDPYAEDIIRDVFFAIEGNTHWMRSYQQIEP